MRDGIGGPERLLVDPEHGAEAAIEAFTPSIDGRLVAYVSMAGVLRVVETGTGRALGDTLDRVQPGGVSWLPDGRSFFYTRLPKSITKGRPRPLGGRVHVHRLGVSPERDAAVFGAGVTPEIPLGEDQVSFGVAPPGSRYVFAAAHRGVAPSSPFTPRRGAPSPARTRPGASSPPRTTQSSPSTSTATTSSCSAAAARPGARCCGPASATPTSPAPRR